MRPGSTSPPRGVSGRGVTQTINGTSGNDELGGADEGDDFIFGRQGNDQLWGFARHDWLFGGPGDDFLYGGYGNDVLRGDYGADFLDGGPGFDWADYAGSQSGVRIALTNGEGSGLGGAAHGDVLTGIEAVFGSSFDDVMTGGAGRQTFWGMDGNESCRAARRSTRSFCLRPLHGPLVVRRRRHGRQRPTPDRRADQPTGPRLGRHTGLRVDGDFRHG